MKSFLQDIRDGNGELDYWNFVDDDDDESFSSATLSSSSSEEEEGDDDGSIVDIRAEIDREEAEAAELEANEEVNEAIAAAAAAVAPAAPQEDNNNNPHRQNENIDDNNFAILPPVAGAEAEDEEEHNAVDDADFPPANDPGRMINIEEQEYIRGLPINRGNHPINRRWDVEAIRQNLRTHPTKSGSVLFRIARSEELPLIRGDIKWESDVANELLEYPAEELGDPQATFLLPNMLRMDPPYHVLEKLFELFPKSCSSNMDAFYIACQYARDEAVQLVMEKTVAARSQDGIAWGPLALLGDARISSKHARMILEHSSPAAILDPTQGPFRVSPLDRMLSGAFIHGNPSLWLKKLKMAMLMAERGKCVLGQINENDVEGKKEKPFYHVHALIRRLVSSDFRGVDFGALSFMHGLIVCNKVKYDHEDYLEQEPYPPPFCQVDDHGNLPLHEALGTPCKTNLRVAGERKLIKYLLRVNRESAMIPAGLGGGVCDNGGSKGGKRKKTKTILRTLLPIQLAVENGWPVYDIISNACPKHYTVGTAPTPSSPLSVKKTPPGSGIGEEQQNYNCDHWILHDILSVKCSPRFGIVSSRNLVRYFLELCSTASNTPAQRPDKNGRWAIHLAISNGWPCHDLILAVAPNSLEMRDPYTRLLPFQMAAAALSPSSSQSSSSKSPAVESLAMEANNEEDNSDHSLRGLSVLYELIREMPLLLRTTPRDPAFRKVEKTAALAATSSSAEEGGPPRKKLRP